MAESEASDVESRTEELARKSEKHTLARDVSRLLEKEFSIRLFEDSRRRLLGEDMVHAVYHNAVNSRSPVGQPVMCFNRGFSF